MSTEAKEIATMKPIETQVSEWSATESVLREAVKVTEGITVAANAESPKKGRDAERVRCEAERKIEEEREELARIARSQAEKPDREKLAQWANLAMGGIPEIPSTESEALYERAEALRYDVKNLLNVFAHEMAVA